MTSSKKITIIELAKACGYSKTTVAYALDGRSQSKVAAKTYEKILAIAKELGYVPNKSARALRAKCSYTIGIMLPEPGNALYGSVIMKLQRELAERGYTALFAFWENQADASSMQHVLDLLISRGVDGIIAGDAGCDFSSCRCPVVHWAEPSEHEDSYSSFPVVKDAYRELFAMLSAKNCRRYAIIASDISGGRSAAIRELLAESGQVVPDEYLLSGVRTQEQARNAMKKLLAMPRMPEVVLANNDYLALAAMGETRRAGIAVPERIKFVGFDGIDEGAYACPSLTTFRVEPDEIAEKLLTLLFRRMEQPDAEVLALCSVPKLIVRESI